MARAKLRLVTAKSLKKLRSALTIALMLWCAGAGCMIVSYAHAARMNDRYAAGVSSAVRDSAPRLMETHHCCKSRQPLKRHVSRQAVPGLSPESFANLEELAEVPNSSSVMSCCPLTSGSIVANGSSRISKDDASESLSVEAGSSVHNGYATTLQANSLRLPNQSHTYLRSCAFLI